MSPEPSRQVVTDASRDELLTDFGKNTLHSRYLLPGESFQDAFARVATTYSDDAAHAQRMYGYISRHWFMPATPVLSNGGAGRGLPISCFLNDVKDSLDGITGTWNENIALASHGGGIGTSWSGVRSIGEKVKGSGETSGIIPFVKVMDSLTLAISQGSLRRGSAAVYLDIHHPEIEEFLEIRKATGDANRKALNLHHGIAITDEFMEAVRAGVDYELRSPKDGSVVDMADARTVWSKILDIRLQTGEPYLIFSDTANRAMAPFQRNVGLKVKQSNLCAEIMLHTGEDQHGQDRTAVCCLSSVNALYFREWSKDPMFVEDCMRFLDNVLQDFIDRAPPEMAKAVYAAKRERAVGLGLMGFHSLLQEMNLPFECAMAKSWNMRIFKHLRREADAASRKLAEERGPCPDAAEAGVWERFSYKLAIAPTASISIIAGGVSAGIEPIPANVYTHKTLSGTYAVKNAQLDKVLGAYAEGFSKGDLTEKARLLTAWWSSILENEGSVQHLEWMCPADRDTFKTAFEIDQRWVVELAADRAGDICQAQSVNVFLPGDVDKLLLLQLHWMAWERGVKSLYYLRSKSVQRAAFAGANDNTQLTMKEPAKFEECLACT